MNNSEDYANEILVPISCRNNKQAVWYLNNTSYFIYDNECVKKQYKRYHKNDCYKRERNRKTSFNDLILKTLHGGMKVLELFYEDECDKDSVGKRNRRLCFNACKIYDKKEYCILEPEKKYDKFCSIFELNVNKIGELIQLGYILCDLIPCTRYGYVKIRLKWEEEKALIWKMISDYANEMNLYKGLKDEAFDIIKLIAENKALNEMFEYNIDETKDVELFKTIKVQQTIMRNLFEQWLEDVEERWESIKKDFNLKV